VIYFFLVYIKAILRARRVVPWKIMLFFPREYSMEEIDLAVDAVVCLAGN